MSRPVVDLAARRALRRDVHALVCEHPQLTGEDAQARCEEWLAGEEPDEHAVEPGTAPADEHAAPHLTNAGRSNARPASRGD